MSDNAQNTERVSREITIYATRGNTMKKIMSDAKTWGELKPHVNKEGFDLNTLLAAENITKHDLINDMAVLPEGAFRLFLRPAKTKSGALDRKQLFAEIKAHVAANPGDKSKFTIDGKNMTQLSTPVLQELYDKHIAKGGAKPATTATPASEEKAKAVPAKAETPKDKKDNGAGDVVKSVGDAKAAGTDSEKVAQAQALIASLSGSYDCEEKVNKHLDKLADEVADTETMAAPDAEPAEETPEARAKREAREEEDAARREAEDMMSGY